MNEFAKMFEAAFTEHVSRMTNKEVTVEYLHELRDATTNAFLEVLKDSIYAMSVSVDAAQWLVNEVFKSVKLCEGTTVNDLIITNDIEVTKVDVLSLTSLLEMFEGTFVGELASAEHRRRMLEE